MRVVGFVGPSGSGKSYRSIFVSREKGTDAIIDDGLLISKNSILAGTSAKKEPTKIASVKRALFVEDKHCKDIKEAIKKHKISSVLILGTSRQMIKRISERLSLGEVLEFVEIEDVATKEEIAKARKVREMQGKHVIPVPTFELKKDFSGYFIAPISFFKNHSKADAGERSVVRPTFSYLGDFKISDTVILEIILHAIKKQEVFSFLSKSIVSSQGGINIKLSLSIKYGANIIENTKELQKEIKKDIERLTAMNVLKIDIVIARIVK